MAERGDRGWNGAGAMAGESNPIMRAPIGVRPPPLLFQFPTLSPQPPFWSMQQPQHNQQQQVQMPGIQHPHAAPHMLMAPSPPPDYHGLQFMAMQQGFQFGNLNFQRPSPAPDLNRPASPPVQLPYISPPRPLQNHQQSQFHAQQQHQQQTQAKFQQQKQVVPPAAPEQNSVFKEPMLKLPPARPQTQQKQQKPQQKEPHSQRKEHQQNKRSEAEGSQRNVYPAPLTSHSDVVADESLFLRTLSRFHEAMGSQLVIPRIGGKDFEVHRLYFEVTEHGGLEQVNKEKKWKVIAAAFALPRFVTCPVYFLRKNYEQLLHHYEQVYFHSKKGPYVSPSGPLPKPLPVSSQPQNDDTSDHETSKKKKGREKSDQAQESKEHPVAPLGHIVTGAIEGKFEHGYFVTVVVGSEKLRGVIYNVPPSQLENKQFADLPELNGSSAAAKPSASPKSTGSDRTKQKRKRETPRKKKDPNAIKPPRNGYNFFVAEQRHKLKAGRDELSKIIGDLWNGLSEQERMPYMEMAQKDKERYNKQILEEARGREG